MHPLFWIVAGLFFLGNRKTLSGPGVTMPYIGVGTVQTGQSRFTQPLPADVITEVIHPSVWVDMTGDAGPPAPIGPGTPGTGVTPTDVSLMDPFQLGIGNTQGSTDAYQNKNYVVDMTGDAGGPVRAMLQ